MKKTLLCLSTVAVLLGPVPSAHAATVPAGMVDPGNVHIDRFGGWGTSLAWGANVVGGWSPANRTAIADLLFSPASGLGLNVVRYHVGAGQAADWQARGCGAQRPGSPVPTFRPSANTWDWAADANQRWFAQAAKGRGADRFVAYASSPPAWMTIMYEPYADYLTEVAKRFRDSWGITFDLLDPLNEPEGGWHRAGNQEGNHFDPGSQDEILNRVGQSLAAKGLTGTKLAAPDGFSVESSRAQFARYRPGLISVPSIPTPTAPRRPIRCCCATWRRRTARRSG